MKQQPPRGGGGPRSSGNSNALPTAASAAPTKSSQQQQSTTTKRSVVTISVSKKAGNGGNDGINIRGAGGGGGGDGDGGDDNEYGYEDFSFPDPHELGQKYGLDVMGSGSPEGKKIYDGVVNDVRQGSEVIERTELLVRKLAKKDQEIEKLCVLLDALSPIPGLDPDRLQAYVDNTGAEDDVVADFRDAKIVSLAKRNRKLTLELGRVHSSADSRALQIQELSEKLNKMELSAASFSGVDCRKTLSAGATRIGAGEIGGGDGESMEELKSVVTALRRDLLAATKTVEDMRRKNTQLNDEVKQLTRLLTNELGDGVGANLEQALAVDGGWRGRAQQIVMLKAKVKKLEQALATAATATAPIANAMMGAANAGSRTQGVLGSRRSNVDQKAENELVEMSNDRKQAVEAIVEERDSLLTEKQELAGKVQALKSRIRNLEADALQHKQNVKVVLSAKEADDELIEALQTEIKRLRGGAAEVTRNNLRAQQQKLQQNLGRQDPDGDLQRLQRLCKQQSEQLSMQDEVIRSLRARLS